jgi:hypothetical protein
MGHWASDPLGMLECLVLSARRDAESLTLESGNLKDARRTKYILYEFTFGEGEGESRTGTENKTENKNLCRRNLNQSVAAA